MLEVLHYSADQLDVSSVALPDSIRKRDNRLVDFEPGRIRRAIDLCFQAVDADTYHYHKYDLDELTFRALNIIAAKHAEDVESIQDIVETVLMSAGEFEAAKAYILYRAERARIRDQDPVTPEIQSIFDESAQYFPTPLQQFQFYDKYSRFDYDKGRRETWPETVNRTVDFLQDLVRENVDGQTNDTMTLENTWERIRSAILRMESMPAMRLLAMAGPAARRQNLCGFNCSFVPVDSIDAFAEALLISMSGCGVGFSVEKRHVNKLGKIKKQHYEPDRKLTVEDTTEGWVESVRYCLQQWFDGYDVEIDYSQIRPAGTPLKIKGGRASGPDPLRNALQFARGLILDRQESYLRPLDAHDIMCQIGNAAVSGGVRRSAMISLFDVDDMEMANCKVGDFETYNSQRWNANNSAILPEEGITQTQFLKIWTAMLDSGRGEPGFVSRQAMKNTMSPRREFRPDMGTNPCGEIVLRPMQLCNLSIAVARSDDTYETLKDKVEVATIIGTIQCLMTNFPGMRQEWVQNQIDERLLGVDITGQRDCPLLEDPTVLRNLRDHAIETNKIWAKRFNINQSAAVTTVKPSGNSAVLLDCASGIHGRWAAYYERNVRVGATSSMYKILRDANVPLQPENGQETWAEPTTYVATFLVAAPEGTPTRNDLSALDQVEYWKHVKQNWTEHNPSVTITYKGDEIMGLMDWVWKNIDILGGMAFLPHQDIQMAKLPYVEISQEEFEIRSLTKPVINFAKLMQYEHTDMTTAAQELACLGSSCDIV